MHRLTDGQDRIVKLVCKRLAYPSGRILRSRIRPNSRERERRRRGLSGTRRVHGLEDGPVYMKTKRGEEAMSEAVIRPAGDSALLVEFENEISLEVNSRVRALKYTLEQSPFDGMGELVPAYRSLLIGYDPLKIRMKAAQEEIRSRLGHMDKVSLPKAVVTEIPVCYDKEYAVDLEHIAQLEHTTEEEVIKIHSQSDYFVYMLGFAPGHPYTARFENPFSFKRMENPRLKIPGGSIVVQLALSDIIPFDQPCGWNIIGSTPVLACDYRKENPFLLKAGQWIHHRPVSKEEYLDIKKQVEAGTYVCRTWEKED